MQRGGILALINRYTRKQNGDANCETINYNGSPAEFVVSSIPDGVPFRCYRDGVEISKDIEAMLCVDGEFDVIESPGGGVVNTVLNLIAKVFSFIVPKQKTPNYNQQAGSANNSLTDRTNKPRPYERAFDICGTVQCIPSDMMQAYKRYDDSHKEFEFGYYYIARGPVETPES